MIAPTLALSEVAKVAVDMAVIAKENVELSLAQYVNYDANRAEKIAENEKRRSTLCQEH